MPFTAFGPTLGNAVPPLSIASGGTGATTAAAALAALGGLVQQASTGLAGFALVNATPTIITWTTPNDGLMHRALIFGTINVTVAQTGGTLQQAYTDPAANGIFSQIDAGGHAAGAFQFTAKLVTCQPNTAVSVRQSVALSAGTATIWAEIWGL